MDEDRGDFQMTTEQARNEIREEVLMIKSELRRALMGELDKDVGEGFLDALNLLIIRKGYMDKDIAEAAKLLILATEDLAISYANSVNIEE